MNRTASAARAAGTRDTRARSAACASGVALTPPASGIDFVDGRRSGRASEQASRTAAPGLPTSLRAGIEKLSGVDVSDVRVHFDSSQPARLHALAYTQGADVHLAPGRESSLAHEAWHVVQQKQGRVAAPASSSGQLAVNRSRTLEREADAMGARAERLGTQLAVTGTEPAASACVPAVVAASRGPSVIQCDTDPEYVRLLEEAAQKLLKLKFGVSFDPKVAFDQGNWSKFTKAYTEAESNGLSESARNSSPLVGLELKPGIDLWEAIDAMFTHVDDWSMDCAEFAQALHFYALRHTESKQQPEGKVRWRQHYSNIMPATGVIDREAANASFDWFKKPKDSALVAFMEGLINAPDDAKRLELCPTGSLVSWTSEHADPTSPFRNENAVKLGDDRYAAHGFGQAKNTFTQDELIQLLAEETLESIGWLTSWWRGISVDTAKQGIYLSSIVLYPLPQKRAG